MNTSQPKFDQPTTEPRCVVCIVTWSVALIVGLVMLIGLVALAPRLWAVITGAIA